MEKRYFSRLTIFIVQKWLAQLSTSSQPKMYADDKSITYPSSDINEINKRLNYDLIKVYVSIDWWPAWVHSNSLDCLFVIYKLSKLIFRFLKTSSRTEVLNKGVLLNWMNADYIQHSFGERKFSLGLDHCIIGGKKTLSKFLIKKLLLSELSIWASQIEKEITLHFQWYRYEILSLSQYHYVFE